MQIAIRVGVYVLLSFITLVVFGSLFRWFENPILAGAGSTLVVGIFANWLVLRIFEQLHVVDAGLWLNRASAENLAIGLAGGIGSAGLVLGPPLLVGAAHLNPAAGYSFSIDSLVFVTILLIGGAIGEELMIHGYAFQLLLREVGPWAT